MLINLWDTSAARRVSTMRMPSCILVSEPQSGTLLIVQCLRRLNLSALPGR